MVARFQSSAYSLGNLKVSLSLGHSLVARNARSKPIGLKDTDLTSKIKTALAFGSGHGVGSLRASTRVVIRGAHPLHPYTAGKGTQIPAYSTAKRGTDYAQSPHRPSQTQPHSP